MKKIIKNFIIAIGVLLTMAGCANSNNNNNFSIDQFVSNAKTYQHESGTLIGNLTSGKYDRTSADKIKESDEYKKLSESLKYFAEIDENKTDGNIKNDVQTVKSKANDVKKYYDNMINEYVNNKEEPARTISEFVRKPEYVTLTGDFIMAMGRVEKTKK